jgi:putative N6-adenine-specific DNA methylase
MKPLDIFLVTAPGLEETLAQEALENGFTGATAVPGGVTFAGHWPAIWRANLNLRGATRVLVALTHFRAFHLSELDSHARAFPWLEIFRPDIPITVEVTCKNSKITNTKRASTCIETAISAASGIPIHADATVTLKVRIDDNACTFSVDTSGEPLHIRNHKEFIGKAPMRENYAAMLLRQCGYDGREPVVDPMCGSGTFVIEAAEIARNLIPGRARNFAFQNLATFHSGRWDKVNANVVTRSTDLHFYGSDRDAGAIKGSTENAQRAAVDDIITFSNHAISDLQRPEGPTGLVIVNPPYGARIGEKKQLFALYGALGKTLNERFKGWRVGVVTAEPGLAKATGLKLKQPNPPFQHGGIRVSLFQSAPLT